MCPLDTSRCSAIAIIAPAGHRFCKCRHVHRHPQLLLLLLPRKELRGHAVGCSIPAFHTSDLPTLPNMLCLQTNPMHHVCVCSPDIRLWWGPSLPAMNAPSSSDRPSRPHSHAEHRHMLTRLSCTTSPLACLQVGREAEEGSALSEQRLGKLKSACSTVANG